MPRKPKYDFDINIIQKGENNGLSRNQIAKNNKWPQSNMEAWIKRNYDRHEQKNVWYKAKK